MAYDKIIIPREGKAITVKDDLSLCVPNDPIIPFIEGDSIGSEITPTMKKVVDVAIQKAYGSKKKIYWMEVYCGEKAIKIYDGNDCPAETLQALKEFSICIKGPLNNPIDGISFNGMVVRGLKIKNMEGVVETKKAKKSKKNKIAEKTTIYQASNFDAKTSHTIESSNDGESSEFHKPRYAGPDKANPLPLLLSAEMMLRDMGWIKGADLMAKAVERAIAKQTINQQAITDEADPILQDEISPLSCSEFGDVIIAEM